MTTYLVKLAYYKQRNRRVIRARVFKRWLAFSEAIESTPGEEMFENALLTTISRLGIKIPKPRHGRKRLKQKRIPKPRRISKPKEELPFT